MRIQQHDQHKTSRSPSHHTRAMVSFRLNGEVVEVPNDGLHQSAASYIRQHTQSVKVSCAEGGCGACAIELLSPGDGRVVAVNSCLLPVAALHGCEVLTSEGLGNSRAGFHEVQERLAAFHGTQCGFCSPGIVVSTHAALMAAADKAGATPSSSSSDTSHSTAPMCNGQSSSSGNGVGATPECAHKQAQAGCKGSSSSSSCRSKAAASAAAAAAGVTRVTAAQLLGALDGNLCRCTGWRPIADCAKSFACDVDIEDLGLNSLSPDRLAPISLHDLTPAALQNIQQQQQQQSASFARALQQLHPGSILAPSSRQQLLAALSAAAEAQLPVHLVGGNTGAGLYKEQWGRLSSSVCVLVRGLSELQQITVTEGPTGALPAAHQNEPATAAPAGAAAEAADGFEGIDSYIGAAEVNGSSEHNKAGGVKHVSRGCSSTSTSTSIGAAVIAGAGVTISRLLESLQDTADALQSQQQAADANSNNSSSSNTATSHAALSASSAKGDPQQQQQQQQQQFPQQQQQQQGVSNLQYMICHMRRIAGTLVRNAATLGGHLALARNQQLESDLVTLMVAAGADTCVTAADGSCHWMNVADLCCKQQQGAVLQQLDQQQAVITAVKLPLPITPAAGANSSSSSGSVSFWSHKLTTHRYSNEHAAVNASIWLQAPASSSSNSSGPDAAGAYTLRIAVGTYQQQPASSDAAHACNGTSSLHTTGQQQQQQQTPDTRQSEGSWVCTRAHALETALSQVLTQQQQQQQQQEEEGAQQSLLQVLAGIPELLLQDIAPAGRLADYVRRVLPGLILKGIAAVLPAQLLQQQAPSTALCNGSNSSNSSSRGINPSLLLELRGCAREELSAAVAGPVYRSGHQDVPVDLQAAPPLYWPTERDSGRIQASGEAVYGDDVPLVSGALHAAYVSSTQPSAQLLGVDWTPALTVPGVVGWVCPQDIPAGPNAVVQPSWAGEQQPLFAHTHVTHVGQALGLVLARSPAAAQAGASKVRVTYGAPVSSSSSKNSSSDHATPPGDSSSSSGSSGSSGKEGTAVEGVEGEGAAKPLTSLAAAVAAGSWHPLDKFPGVDKASTGDVSAAMSGCARVLSGQVKAGSQRHFYMEPQVAVVTPDEAGRLQVVSSCQGCDIVMYGVCRALKLRHNEVHVTSKRVGGGFGGKASAAVWHAAAAAVAAHKFRRQVRLVVPQSVDVCMTAGRCPMVLDWRAGVDEGGRIQALQLDLSLMDGAYGGGIVEAMSMKAVADSVYDVQHLDFSLRLARTNMPPRSTVRGPGKVSMLILLELVMQQLAAATGHDADQYRQMHMLQLPADALAAAAAAAAAAGEGDEDGTTAAAAAPVPKQAAGQQQQQQQQQQDVQAVKQHVVIPHPKYLPNKYTASTSTSNTTDDSSSSDSSKDGDSKDSKDSSSSSSLRTSLGQVIEVHQYTLPYMVQQVQAASDYTARRAAVDAFNAAHTSRKRGLALVPVRYPLYRSFYTGRVTIYCDGSVLLSHAGVEIGQGISAKVKQTAAAALGQLLPPEARPALLPLIRVAGGSTEVMAHAGLAAGSTTSEGTTAAIAAACEELVGRLQGSADALSAEGKEVTWEAVVKGVCGWEVVTTKVLLTASARSGLHDEASSPAAAMYHAFGVGAAEVEVDCLTGERRLLRADLLFDAGRSVSPAIDLGQVEGAFMQGVGHVMTEEVVEDEASGANLTADTWTYKPPGIAELPQAFNVSMLRDSPCHVPQRQQLSAKATGEPPLMMAAAVACALQDAVHAAWRQYEQRLQQQGQAVQGPDSWPVLELPATTANIQRALPSQLA